MIQLKLAYFSNCEWANDPAFVHVELSVTKAAMFKAVEALAACGADSMQFSYAGTWKFFDPTNWVDWENEDSERVETEPDYRVDGVHLRIGRDGAIDLRFPFKNGPEHGWADTGHLTIAGLGECVVQS